MQAARRRGPAVLDHGMVRETSGKPREEGNSRRDRQATSHTKRKRPKTHGRLRLHQLSQLSGLSRRRTQQRNEGNLLVITTGWTALSLPHTSLKQDGTDTASLHSHARFPYSLLRPVRSVHGRHVVLAAAHKDDDGVNTLSRTQARKTTFSSSSQRYSATQAPLPSGRTTVQWPAEWPTQPMNV